MRIKKANTRCARFLALAAMIMAFMSHTTPLWASSANGTPIVICSSFGTKTIIIDENGNQIPQDDSTAIKHCAMCLNAAMHALAARDLNTHAIPAPELTKTGRIYNSESPRIYSNHTADRAIRAPPAHS